MYTLSHVKTAKPIPTQMHKHTYTNISTDFLKVSPIHTAFVKKNIFKK